MVEDEGTVVADRECPWPSSNAIRVGVKDEKQDLPFFGDDFGIVGMVGKAVDAEVAAAGREGADGVDSSAISKPGVGSIESPAGNEAAVNINDSETHFSRSVTRQFNSTYQDQPCLYPESPIRGKLQQKQAAVVLPVLAKQLLWTKLEW